MATTPLPGPTGLGVLGRLGAGGGPEEAEGSLPDSLRYTVGRARWLRSSEYCMGAFHASAGAAASTREASYSVLPHQKVAFFAPKLNAVFCAKPAGVSASVHVSAHASESHTTGPSVTLFAPESGRLGKISVARSSGNCTFLPS
jgi:hypothetical protein